RDREHGRRERAEAEPEPGRESKVLQARHAWVPPWKTTLRTTGDPRLIDRFDRSLRAASPTWSLPDKQHEPVGETGRQMTERSGDPPRCKALTHARGLYR